MLQALSRPRKPILTWRSAGRKFIGRSLGSISMEAEEGKEAGLGRGRRQAAKVSFGPEGHLKAGLHNCAQLGQGGWTFLPPCQTAIAHGPPEEGGMTLSS